MIRAPRVSLFLIVFFLIGSLVSIPARAGTVSVAWDPVTDPDLAGYRVFYGLVAGNYTQQVDVGLTTQQTVTGLTDCTTWYFAVKSIDAAGNLSTAFSNEIAGWSRPTVTAVSPLSAEPGRQMDITIDGTNLQTGAAVTFEAAGITVNSVTVNGCGQAVANITVGDTTAPGSTLVNVINPDQTFGSGAGLFAVEAIVSPAVQSSIPTDGATAVAVAVQSSLTFSEPLDAASISAATVQLLDAAGNAVALAPGSPALSGDGLTVTLVPAAALSQGATYRLRALGGTGGVRDLAGHPLAGTFTQATGFTTATDTTPPVVSSVANSGVTATSGTITWITDELSDGQVLYRVQGGSAYQQTATDPTLVTDHGILVQGLTPGTTYEFHVRSADSSGNAAVSTPDSTFTTLASNSTFLIFEAEGGELTAPLRGTNGGGAFGDAWVDTPANTPTGTSTAPAGTAVFGVNLPKDATWYLWVRVMNRTGSGATLYEAVDGAVRQTLDVSAAGTWEWVAGRSDVLTAGQHSLELGGRQAEGRADRILLTDDAGFVPTEQPVDDVTPPASPSGFSVTGSDGVNVLGWTNPPDTDLARIIIRVRTDGVSPTSPVDGLAVADTPATAAAGDTFTHSGLTNGTAYRYSVFALDSSGNVSAAAQAEGTPVDNVPPSAVFNLRRSDTVSGP
ncbi:MAG: Ig-like domain-containing protein [Acidobacteriota bacterium]